MSTKYRLLIGLAGIVIIVGAGVSYVVRMARPTEHDGIRGTITAIDPATRTASLELKHPKTGDILELDGEVAPECEIIFGEAPIALDDIPVGSRVEASGLLYRMTRRIIATRVVVLEMPGAPAPPAAADDAGEATEPPAEAEQPA